MLYVANTIVRNGVWYAELLGFAGNANGNVSPTLNIVGRKQPLGGAATAVAVDKSGRRYMIGHWFNQIDVWAADSNENSKPIAHFNSSCGNLSFVNLSFVFDRTGNLWVACGGEGENSAIVEFPPLPAGATGGINLTPIREITGSSTKTAVNYPRSIAINPNGQVSIENYSLYTRRRLIFTFDPTENGFAAPRSQLGGDRTLLGVNGYGGISYDSQGRLVACTNLDGVPRLLTFATGAKGNVAPISILSIAGCNGVAVDSQDNVYVAFANSITEYAPVSTGSAKPLRTISGNLTTLSNASSVAF